MNLQICTSKRNITHWNFKYIHVHPLSLSSTLNTLWTSEIAEALLASECLPSSIYSGPLVAHGARTQPRLLKYVKLCKIVSNSIAEQRTKPDKLHLPQSLRPCQLRSHLIRGSLDESILVFAQTHWNASSGRSTHSSIKSNQCPYILRRHSDWIMIDKCTLSLDLKINLADFMFNKDL